MATRGEAEFLNLPFQAKLDFLYGLPARTKRDLILSAPEAERLVQSFSPETLFYTLKEIGQADAGDLLEMALPEQVKGLFDLDCWSKDRPNLDRMREWLEAMAEGGRRRIADALMELDLELVTLFLRQYVRVYRLDEAQAALDVLSRNVLQLDEQYVIEFVRRDNVLPLVQEFIEEVFERDYDYYASLLEEIYWGVEAELEEEAYAFRSARLSDRGFPDYYAAQDVFAYLNPRQFLEIRRNYETPSREDLLTDEELGAPELSLVDSGPDTSLFNAALTAGFAANGKRQLRSEMALVTNQVLVARSIDFGDPAAVHEAVELTHHFLNLGLENLAAGDLRSAVEHLRDTHLKLLFRLGVSLTIDLRKRAQETVQKLGLAAERTNAITYLDTPYGEALEGFLQRMPRFFAGLEDRGAVVMRDFATMRDVHLGYAMLDQIEAIPALFAAIGRIDLASPGFRSAVAGRDLKLSQILITTLVNSALDGRLAPEPLAARRLNEIRAALMTRGQRPAGLTDAFHAHVEQTLRSELDDEVRERSADYVNACLNLFEEEFAELDPEIEIDPRFVRCILLRA
jgi:hypothetical protein